MTDLEKLKLKFNKDILEAVEETKKLGYNPIRFMQMFATYNQDGVKVAMALVPKEATSGVTTLWEKGRLDLTMEARVVKPEFKELFPSEIIELCKKRLRRYGYKI